MVRKDISQFLAKLPKNVTVVAATKYVDSDSMLELYKNGIKDFGENRVDSFLAKFDELKDYSDIVWHFIGHLQKNKAKKVINKIDYLHSLDSLQLAKIIEKEREEPLPVFVEISINLEESKNGVPYYEASNFIKELLRFKKIKLVGLMMMAVKGSLDTESQFDKLYQLKLQLEKEFNISLPYLSMGMSDDYESAIKAHSTHLRLGRILYE